MFRYYSDPLEFFDYLELVQYFRSQGTNINLRKSLLRMIHQIDLILHINMHNFMLLYNFLHLVLFRLSVVVECM